MNDKLRIRDFPETICSIDNRDPCAVCGICITLHITNIDCFFQYEILQENTVLAFTVFLLYNIMENVLRPGLQGILCQHSFRKEM